MARNVANRNGLRALNLANIKVVMINLKNGADMLLT